MKNRTPCFYIKRSIAALCLLALFSVPALAADAARSVYSSYVIPTGSIYMIAHRGYSAAAPENTLPAFRLAGEHGFWGAECDISVTADDVWVIMHDSTVDRTTNGTGKIEDLTYAEICEMTVDAGSNVEQFPGTKVPTLTEYLDICLEYGMHPVIEIKERTPLASMEDLAALLSARGEKAMFSIISFSRPLAARIKELMPETPVYLLIGGAPQEEFFDGIRFCLEHNLDGVDFASVWDKDMVKAVQKAGLKPLVWTVDDIETAENYYKWGVRDITTNALTPGKPRGNVFQRMLWSLRDRFYKFTSIFENGLKKLFPDSIC